MGRNIVEITAGEGERIATLGRHQPELVPLLPEIRRVYDALAVWREIRSRLPRRFFVVNLVRFGARFCFHAPETARAIDVVAIRNEKYLSSVRRPGRADLMIELAVIIASQIAAVLSGQALHLAQVAISELSDKDVEMPVKRSGNESDPFAVGRETWLDVDRAPLGELLRAFGLQV